MAYAASLNDFRHAETTSLFAQLREAIASYRMFRQTLTELEQLTDRELLDLNLSRHSLRDVAREAAYGR